MIKLDILKCICISVLTLSTVAFASDIVCVHDGWPATDLMLAAKNGNLPLVEKLLSSGADVNQEDDAGNTALIYSAFSDNAAVTQSLVDAGAHLDIVDVCGETALEWAAVNSEGDVATVLVKSGADPNIVDSDGNTALTAAALFSEDLNLTVFRALLSVPEKLDFLSRALPHVVGHQPSSADAAPITRLLLDSGANPNVPGDYRDYTALLVALIPPPKPWTHTIVSLLISAHADVNVQRDGWTPLMLAATPRTFVGEHGIFYEALQNQLIRDLIAAGAKREAVNSENKTAYDLAKENNEPASTLKLLMPDLTLSSYKR